MKPLLLCKNCGAPIRYSEDAKDYIHEARADEPGELFGCQYTKGYEHLKQDVYAEPSEQEPPQSNISAIDELFS